MAHKTLTMPPELERRIKQEAQKEQRHFGPMLRILAQEALAARSQAQG
ncbi:hypothetical protein ROS1_28510 [Roseibium sp. ROS1]